MKPLDPKAVAGIDMRHGRCAAWLDHLVAKYHEIEVKHGSAAAAGVLSLEFHNIPISGVGDIIDTLAFAIARLSDQQLEKQHGTDQQG